MIPHGRRKGKKYLKKQTRDRLIHGAIKLLQWIIPKLPLPIAEKVGVIIGIIVFHLAKKGRNRAIKQLMVVLKLPKDKATKVARNNFIHLGKSIVEFLYFPRLDGELLKRVIPDVQGKTHLDEAIAMGNGVIILTGHIGNWELGAAWLSMNGYRLNVVAASQGDEFVDNTIFSYREKTGTRVIPKNRSLKEIIKALQRKELLGILIDQDAKEKGVIVDFLGIPASTPTGITSLSRKFRCPIIPLFTIRQKNNRFSLEILPPIFATDDKHTLALLNNILGDYIKRYPEQWIWFYQRWNSTNPI